MMTPDRWEHGSEFHWPLVADDADARSAAPWEPDGAMMGSGRDALRLLIAHGVATHGWERLWVPSYMCQHVIEALVETGISCHVYEDAPTQPGPTQSTLNSGPRDAVLLVNYFGLRGVNCTEALDLGQAALIVDHTHDPLSSWAFDKGPDYAVASLRKTLPIADGGVLWSPRGHGLPEVPLLTEVRAAASEAKMKAMRLKGHYLAGELVSKADFRALATEGEEGIAHGEISGMVSTTAARLATFPLQTWRERRRANHRVIAEGLKGVEGLKVLAAHRDTCPFSAFVVFDTEARRERVRQALIQASIYPALLWPMNAPVLEGVSDMHRALGDRILSVHCDMRYDTSDIHRVVSVLCEAASL